jgi:hypothetical protein
MPGSGNSLIALFLLEGRSPFTFSGFVLLWLNLGESNKESGERFSSHPAVNVEICKFIKSFVSDG